MLKIGDAPVTEKSRRSKRRKSPKTHKIRTVNYEKILRTMEKVKPRYLNLPLACLVVGISLFGLVMLYNASSYNSLQYYGTRFYYVTSQSIGLILGFGLMILAYFVDYKFYKKTAWLWYILGAVLLVLVFVPGLGISRLGSSRWIGVAGFTMQPSEIAKFAFLILASAIASKTVETLGFKKFAIILLCGLGYCALILLEPNLSITIVLGATVFVVLFLFGAKLKHLACVVIPALVALPVMLIAEPYRVRRLLAFIDPWENPKDEGFQLIQSLFGLGNGGLFGVGLGNSTQKHMFLPFSESDFIFSIIGEELGFIGAVGLLLAILGMVVLIFRVGLRCENKFGKYLCFGIATILFLQSAVNLAVVTGTIPPTGVPLPFISFGGTSLAVYMAVIGIVLNIDKQNRKQST